MGASFAEFQIPFNSPLFTAVCIASLLLIFEILSSNAQSATFQQRHTAPAPGASFRYLNTPGLGDVPLQASVPSWVFSASSSPPSAWPPAAPASPPLPSVAQLRGAGKFTSQDGEDEYAMLHFFAGKRGGIMIESGALDGRMFSISAALVGYWGWRAVHIEAGPTNFKALLANRPESLNIHAALCNSTTPLHWVSVEEITSINGFWEMLAKEVKDKWYTHITPEVLASLPATTCRPLTPMLEMFGLRHIDLWVLDIEGSEYMALSTVDWARTQIDVISVEVLPPQTAEEQEHESHVVAMLTEAGYWVHSTQNRNTWWVRDGFAPSSCEHNPALCAGSPVVVP